MDFWETFEKIHEFMDEYIMSNILFVVIFSPLIIIYMLIVCILLWAYDLYDWIINKILSKKYRSIYLSMNESFEFAKNENYIKENYPGFEEAGVNYNKGVFKIYLRRRNE